MYLCRSLFNLSSFYHVILLLFKSLNIVLYWCLVFLLDLLTTVFYVFHMSEKNNTSAVPYGLIQTFYP